MKKRTSINLVGAASAAGSIGRKFKAKAAKKARRKISITKTRKRARSGK
tara:strand:- start:212 stop:358 length:147 start_codon:yes stop_codon:yes gene_type:complete